MSLKLFPEKSFLEDLTAYATTRLMVGRITLLWLVLSACALIVSGEISLVSAMLGSVLAATLIAQFRLWDDLADREYDAVSHPQRVLVTTSHARRVAYLCGVLTLPITATLVFGYGTSHLLVYVSLFVAMALLYAYGGTAMPRLLRAHLVLLKYPIIIWLCAQQADVAQWARVSASVYLALCLFELASDSDLRRSTARRSLMAIEAASLAALLVLIWRIST